MTAPESGPSSARVTRAEDGPLSGAVIDFVDLGWWPVFNVADSAIVCGVTALIWLAWRQEKAVDERDDEIIVSTGDAPADG